MNQLNRRRIITAMSMFSLHLMCLYGQETARDPVAEYRRLQAKLDSLAFELTKLRAEIGGYNVTTADSLLMMGGHLLDVTGDSTDKVGDQRSRRKRLDALLEEYLQRPGMINFNGDATGILQGSFGGEEDIGTATGSFDLFVATHLGAQTLLFVDLEAIGGNGPDENIAAFAPLNGDGGSTQTTDGLDRMHVLEAWVEFSAFGDLAIFTAGKIDLTNYFDNNAAANDETAQFISGAFVNSAALPVPGNTPGIRVRGEIPPGIFFQLAAVSADNSGNRILEQLFKIASTGFRIDFGRGLLGTFRVYGYQHEVADNGVGYGISADLPLQKNLTVFGRWTRNEDRISDYFGIASAWSTGLQLESRIGKAPLFFGAAFGETRPADEALRREHLAEIYFRLHLNQWTHISPHLQWVENPAGGTERYFIAGLRTQFDF